MTSRELKQKFIKFFEDRGHARIKNSSLIPENDPSALFINSGMHPIVPYLLGQPHPQGKRLCNYQRAVRTGDIEEVGVKLRHNTYFDMLGEWSLGDYWKKESLTWSMEFFVTVLGLDPKRIYSTVFRGNNIVPRDEEAITILKDIYKSYGIETGVSEGFDDQANNEHIVALGEDDNFWTVGKSGPCGPTAEFYYDRGLGKNSDERFLEICNNVFMAYNLTKEGNLEPLKQQNIDVGWGIERMMSVIENILPNGDIPLSISVFDTEIFKKERDWLIQEFGKTYSDYENDAQFCKAVRIILDHIRASVMIIADGIQPSNKDQGYVLRRLIRRSVAFGRKYTQSIDIYKNLAELFIERLGEDEDYSHVTTNRNSIIETLFAEIKKFEAVLKNGIKELNKVSSNNISGEIAFRLKEALGLPIEITTEIAEQAGKTVDIQKYEELMNQHQEKSRTGGEKKFVGGLGDHSEQSIRYHTCAHLFLAAAQKVLGDSVHQKGQNITPERLRYDISYSTPIAQEDLQKIENWVNEQINKNLTVDFIETSLDEAKKLGAEGVFADKYSQFDKVKIYRIYDASLPEYDSNKYVSLEFCGGPHVPNTNEIQKAGKFKIVKEESSSQGVRRIKAVLEL